MRIWLLRPRNPSAPYWDASVYAGDVYVRAPSAEMARAAVCARFCRTGLEAGVCATNTATWTNPESVSVQPVDHPVWPVDGPLEILHPLRDTVRLPDVASPVDGAA